VCIIVISSPVELGRAVHFFAGCLEEDHLIPVSVDFPGTPATIVISSTLDESADNGSIPIPISRILRFQG
jgi:hypothetical protein